jgi:TonB family protein
MLLDQPQRPRSKRWSSSLIASFALHVAALIVILHRPAAVFVTPSSLAQGNGARSYHVLYFAASGPENPEPVEKKQVTLVATKRRIARQKAVKAKAEQQVSLDQKGDVSDHNVTAGSPYGSLYEGPTTGHDIRPAYPVIFPDPPLNRAALQGDVIIEVTIDSRGNVVETKLLQGIGQVVDETIVATLRNWRFNPATMDGSPIAEKHDVHFHFPS